MAIQFKFFMIPVKNNEDAEAELNSFLQSVRVISLHREFVSQGNESFFSIIVEYLKTEAGSIKSAAPKGKPRIDYKEVLSPENFAIFAKLRDWRKEAAAEESIPVYTILNNEQLAKIVEQKIINKNELTKIDGIGDARVNKYGDQVVKIVKQEITNKTGKQGNEKSS